MITYSYHAYQINHTNQSSDRFSQGKMPLVLQTGKVH